MIYGPNNLPAEITFKTRPTEQDNLPAYVAESVADFCRANYITEQMIRDISMEVLTRGEDDEGSYTMVKVRFYYR